jgi:hypothetical protein
MAMRSFKNIPEDDCVEAEIVSGPGSFSGGGAPRGKAAGGSEPPTQGSVNIPFYGLFQRVKLVFIAAILLAAFGLIALGLILTSTIIGAIIGVPLLILGGLCLWLLFKLLTPGQKNRPVVFRRF